MSIARIAKAAQCSSGAKQTAIAALDATEAAGSAGESTPKGCRTWLLAERAAGLKCRVLAANRSPVADPAPAETVYHASFGASGMAGSDIGSLCGSKHLKLVAVADVDLSRAAAVKKNFPDVKVYHYVAKLGYELLSDGQSAISLKSGRL